MTIFEKASLLISSISLLFSLIAIYMVRRANFIARWNLEASLNQRISESRELVDNIALDIVKYHQKKKQSKIEIEIIKKRLYAAIENNLNVYNEACLQYEKKRIDKNSFKSNYFNDIKNLVEEEDYNKYFDSVSSPYKSILRVYSEWFNA